MARRVASAIALLLVLSGCSVADQPEAPASAEQAAVKKDSACQRPRYRDVIGQRPALKARKLSRFANDRAACAGWWLPKVDPGFVPQGLALDGATAWVSGWSKSDRRFPFQTCRLMQVDLKTGKLLRYAPLVKGKVGRTGPRVCRHGDGVDITSRGVWLTETDRVWLLDPKRVGKKRMIKRAWRVLDPMRASVATISGGSLGLASFQKQQPGRLDWFPIEAMMARGAIDLAPGKIPKDARRRLVGSRSQTVPNMVQGLTVAPDGRIVFSRSVSRCGTLVIGKRNLGFLPGAEDIEYDGAGGLWVLSETVASKSLTGGDRPVVPELVRFDVAKLMKGRSARCLRHP
mgnify:CR=1 FL=1